MEYPVETFTEAERARLAPHVTNLDQPVFALVNLPETVKGALFARYSRYQGTLRRLFLDEFADSLPPVAGGACDGDEGERAAQLYERIFVGYGDDYIWTGPTKPLENDAIGMSLACEPAKRAKGLGHDECASPSPAPGGLPLCMRQSPPST